MTRSAWTCAALGLAVPFVSLRGAEPVPVNAPGRATVTDPQPVQKPAAGPPTDPDLRPVADTYDQPLGFAGPGGFVPRSGSNAEFDTVEDRWRIGSPSWDRYEKGHPAGFDYPYTRGHWWDPYNLNVLKGDYPVWGNETFFALSGVSDTLVELRNDPRPSSPAARGFFSRSDQVAGTDVFQVTAELFQGDAAYKPADWRVRLTPAFALNLVNPDNRTGRFRDVSWATLQEWFAECKLADLSPEYDFVSVRAGAQAFTSDFRGFLFSDVSRGVRLFGNSDGNRTQYNLAYFRPLEKETGTQLNTFRDRGQDVVIANVYRQDAFFAGYNLSASVHYSNDRPDFQLARTGAQVRPDPVGAARPHRVEAVYLGVAGDGHIDEISLSHAVYWVLGRDGFNPLAGKPQNVNAQFAALELSYTRDWARFRVSGLWASGDGNPNDGHATGFDSILENSNFGGLFGFWRRQRLPLFGVGLTNDQSLLPDLRSGRTQGQANFVNPGLFLLNAGVDLDLTTTCRVVNNVNLLWFDTPAPVESLTGIANIDRRIGVDLSAGVEYRPFLNNNVILIGGLSGLIPGAGFKQIYNKPGTGVPALASGFVELILSY